MTDKANLRGHKELWESLAEFDPMWAILTTDEKKGRRWDSEEFFRNGREEIQSLMDELKPDALPRDRKTALDFGCGIGRLSQALTAYFDSVTGVDISSEMVRVADASNRSPEKCRYRVNDTGDLRQFPDGTFDLIYSNMVLQHVASNVSAVYIREFVRIAREGGTIVFQIPTAMHWRRRVQWRRRLFYALTAAGLQPSFVVRTLGLNPMRMDFIPRESVERLLTASGAPVIHVKSWSDGFIESCRFIAVKGAQPGARAT